MNVVDQVREGGWGSIFLFVYVAGLLYMHPVELDRLVFVIAATFPCLVLIYLSISFNDRLMELLAGDEIREVFLQIKEKRGDEEFYWDADSDIQDSVDDLDGRAHRYAVTVLSGLVISLTLPFAAWTLYGWKAGLVGVPSGVLVGYLLSYRSYIEIGEVIKSSVKLYDNNDEG